MTVVYQAVDCDGDSICVETLKASSYYMISVCEEGEYKQVALTWKQVRNLYCELHESLMETAHEVEE